MITSGTKEQCHCYHPLFVITMNSSRWIVEDHYFKCALGTGWLMGKAIVIIASPIWDNIIGMQCDNLDLVDELAPAQPIRFGRNMVSCGMAISSMISATSTIRKWVTPRKMVCIGTLVMPWMTKTLRPTGGVMRPISVTLTTRIPNQIGSKLSWGIRG